jgi:hypothetical protein
MFNTTKSVNLTARDDKGNRTKIDVRWPNDQEWEERTFSKKAIVTRLGRGKVTTEFVNNLAVDQKLYNAIKLNGAVALEPAEASRIVEALAMCEIRGAELDAQTATVTLGVPGQEVTHTFERILTAAEALTLRKSGKQVELPFNRAEGRVGVMAGAKLWDACGGSSDDYEGDVPALHKDAAIRAVMQAVDSELASGFDETDSF